ncbi:MAG: sensor histidine kinase [Candidatus Acidiferrales bacterium]
MSSPKSQTSPPRASLSEAHTLRALLDSSGAPAFALDSDQRLFFANRAWTQLTRISLEAFNGKSVAEFVDLISDGLADAAGYRKRLETLAADPEKNSVELMDYNTDKRNTFKELSQPIRLADGTRLGRLFLYFDITREKELDQTKSEFISIASHELRTPMTSIKGSLDLLLGGFAGDVNEEARELLVIGHSGCERLIRLINDILDLSKIEAGRMQLRLQPMSVLDSVQRSVRTIKSYADGLNVKLAIDSPSSPADILGDRDRLDQVVTNLLGNAIKFSPSESTVTVAVRTLGAQVECRVIDHGPGIPADEVERIFDKFHQVGTPTKKKGGTGLGLAIARALVQEHNGRLWVESEVGRGCQFVFAIPAAPAGP